MFKTIRARLAAMYAADRALENLSYAEERAGVPAGVETDAFVAANRRAYDAWQALPRPIRWIWS